MKYLDKLVDTWKKEYGDLKALLKTITSQSITKQYISDKELAKKYKQFFDLSTKIWSYSLLGEGCDDFSTHGLIPALQKELQVSDAEAREIGITLSQAKTKSFLDRERLNLFKISLLKGKPFQKALQEHTQQYYWMKHNYLTECIITDAFFLEQIKEIRAKYTVEEIKQKIKKLENYEEEIAAKKAALYNKYHFTKDLELSLSILEMMSWWIDERKVMMLETFHLLFIFLNEMNNRYPCASNLIRYAMPDELIAMLETAKPIPEKLLIARKKSAVYAINEQFEEAMFDGKNSELIHAAYWGKFKMKQLQGLVACSANGSIIADVCVAKDVTKDHFKEGSVLVTSMTRPEFVPLMRKAGAIITDEGGITCHAAIVSRELNIPCIIGTKHATKILKTGNTIHLDVNKGTVQVIK
ncbi:hypothetical protein HYY69_03960 [Candidatus Woesearchaeota archaeon]|nr:hypothetical protein [Candidatus Woesearchaeota archaeon]